MSSLYRRAFKRKILPRSGQKLEVSKLNNLFEIINLLKIMIKKNFVLILALALLSGCFDSNVSAVKNLKMPNPEFTYGDLADREICKSNEWKTSKDNDKQTSIAYTCVLKATSDTLALAKKQSFEAVDQVINMNIAKSDRERRSIEGKLEDLERRDLVFVRSADLNEIKDYQMALLRYENTINSLKSTGKSTAEEEVIVNKIRELIEGKLALKLEKENRILQQMSELKERKAALVASQEKYEKDSVKISETLKADIEKQFAIEHEYAQQLVFKLNGSQPYLADMRFLIDGKDVGSSFSTAPVYQISVTVPKNKYLEDNWQKFLISQIALDSLAIEKKLKCVIEHNCDSKQLVVPVGAAAVETTQPVAAPGGALLKTQVTLTQKPVFTEEGTHLSTDKGEFALYTNSLPKEVVELLDKANQGDCLIISSGGSIRDTIKGMQICGR